MPKLFLRVVEVLSKMLSSSSKCLGYFCYCCFLDKIVEFLMLVSSVTSRCLLFDFYGYLLS